ncbi:MFS transporter [Paenibacillus pabuli]|uniref:MFS transporter n=1 Tax=Paenibacillus pabuli TaxID=1472 RepID=UPI00078611F9|nr:MFS transporter [Paenibacillus pabuli]MEC0128804.1 MFS transporter [Paenibacillus pabuli]
MLFGFSMLSLLQKEPGYRRIFIAGMVNGIGDRFSQIAVLSLILSITGSGLAVGLVLGLRVLPFLVLAPAGGLLTMHFSRRTIMLMTNLLRVPLALSYLFVNHADDLWILYTVSTLLACAEALYAPVRKSGIPLLVQPGNLLRINGLEQVMNGTVLIVGALIGGITSSMMGPQAAFITNALCFLTAAMVIRKISFPSERDAESGEISIENGERSTSVSASVTSDHTSGITRDQGEVHVSSVIWRLVRSSVVLQMIILFELWVPVINGIDNVLISVYAIEVFALGDWGVGMFYAALGTGLVLSSWCSRYFQHWLLPGVIVCLLVEGGLLMLLSIAAQPWLASLIYVLLALMSGVGNTCLDTLLMRETPKKYRGLIFGLVTACSSCMLGLSMFGAGLLLEVVEPRTLGFAGGLGFAAIAVLLTSYGWLRAREAFNIRRMDK